MKKLFVVTIIGMTLSNPAQAGLKDVVRFFSKPAASRDASVIFGKASKIEAGDLAITISRNANKKQSLILDKVVGEGRLKLSVVADRNGTTSLKIESKELLYADFRSLEDISGFRYKSLNEAGDAVMEIPLSKVGAQLTEEVHEHAFVISERISAIITKLNSEAAAKRLNSVSPTILSRKAVPLNEMNYGREVREALSRTSQSSK